MPYDFAPPVRDHLPLLLGFAGGTGSGKTLSGLLTGRGLAGGHPFAAIDTENRRMNHYADEFPELRVTQMSAPFRPDRYADAIAAAAKFLEREQVPAQHRVVLVDSMSHEWAGDGGCLDWHAELTGGQPSKNQQAWATVKPAHKRMVTRLLQLDAHVVLCFRAEPKIEEIDDPDRPGKKKWVPKRGVTALDGWFPVTEKMLPYELTASFLLMADAPGVPRPIKLQAQHRPMVPLDRPVTADVGKALGEWAAGGVTTAAAPAGTAHPAAGAGAGTDGNRAPAPTTLDDDPLVAVAAMSHPPAGVNGVTESQAAYTLEQILATGDRGRQWFAWALEQVWPDDFDAALRKYAAARIEQVPA